MGKRINKIKEWYFRYERHAGIAALMFGFVWDNLTLTRIDLWLDNLILFSYLTIAGASVVLLNLHDAGRIRIRNAHQLDWWLPLIMQFAFGGIFSGYVVFYSRSGSLVSSWPFILGLAALLIGNEAFRGRYERMIFRMSIFYVALFSFCIFYIPILAKAIGDFVFLLSGAVSLVVFGLIVLFLRHKARAYMRGARQRLFLSIGSIYLAFNVLYFTNIIPPLPLSLKDLDLFYSVTRVSTGGYEVTYEPKTWYEKLPFVPEEYTYIPGTTLYAFSAVFAPTGISTSVRHRWSYFDERTRTWRITSTVGFGIVGGRDGGYRGYSIRNNLTSGKWRVDVVTARGQLLGRKTFYLVEAPPAPDIEHGVR